MNMKPMKNLMKNIKTWSVLSHFFYIPVILFLLSVIRDVLLRFIISL